MIIRRWKKTSPFPQKPGPKFAGKSGGRGGSRNPPHFHIGIPLLGLLLFAPLPKLSSEVEVLFRPYPGVYIPLESGSYSAGFGAAAALDLRFSPALGLSAQGEFINMRTQAGSSIVVLDGSLGPTIVWRPISRFSLTADITGGVYSAQWNDKSISGISAGGRLSAALHISPYLTIMAYGGYKHFAYTPEPFMNSISAGAGVSINLSEIISKKTRIRAETVRRGMIFPVSYAWYNDNPFGSVRITNLEAHDISMVNTYFYLEQYMAQPKLCDTHTILKPGESIEVPLMAFFNESILELTENITANAQLIVEYRSLGSPRRTEIPLDIPIYHRNAMTWDDDRRAASFVSPRDPAALWFSRYVSAITSNRMRPGVNRNIQYAIGLFEALNIYGINYVIDPSSSYVELSGSSGSLDSLNYPYQTLIYRGGDCDDLSILFSSLLEAVGIQTAFVTIPGHIYMAFDSGMGEEEARKNFYAPEELVFYEGRAWVPLEITIPKEGFYRAWRIGAKEWRDADRRGEAVILPMEDSWRLYPPVSVSGAASRFSLPAETVAAAAFDRSVDTFISYEIRPRIQEYETRLARGEDPEVRNDLGILYGRYGMIAQAQAQFIRCTELEYIHGWVNMGHIAFMEQRFRDALWYYQRALALDPDNNLAILGLARCYYELNDFSASDTYYGDLRRRDRSLAGQYAYLASFFENQGRAYSLSDRLNTTTWSRPGPAESPAPVPAPAVPQPEPEPEPPPLPVLPAAPPPELPTLPLPGPSAPAEPVPAVPPPAVPPPAPARTEEEEQTTGTPPDPAGASPAGPDPEAPAPAEPAAGEEPGGLSAMLSIGGVRLQSIQEETPALPTLPPDPAGSVPIAPAVPAADSPALPPLPKDPAGSVSAAQAAPTQDGPALPPLPQDPADSVPAAQAAPAEDGPALPPLPQDPAGPVPAAQAAPAQDGPALPPLPKDPADSVPAAQAAPAEDGPALPPLPQDPAGPVPAAQAAPAQDSPALPPLPQDLADSVPAAQADVEPPASADAENAGSEEKSKYSEENVESSEELRYIEDSSEITPIQPKSHLRGKSLLTIAACAGAGLAIVAGLFGLRFRRRRKKGAKKGKHENKA